MSDESFESLWRHAIREHVRAMPAGELNDLVAQVRPEAADVRASIAAKTAQLQSVPRDHNGPLGSMQAAQAAIDARGGNPQPPAPPETEPVAQQGPTPFAINRGQSQSSSGAPMPETEKNRNARLIGDQLMKRGTL